MTLFLFAGRVSVVVACKHKKLLGSHRMKICLVCGRVDFLVVCVSEQGCCGFALGKVCALVVSVMDPVADKQEV